MVKLQVVADHRQDTSVVADRSRRYKTHMDETRAWLRLASTRGIGAAQARDLLSGLGSARTIVAAPRSELGSLGISRAVAANLAHPDEALIDTAMAWLEQDPAHHLIPIGSTNYPVLLGEIQDPPVVLFVKGQKTILCEPQLAIVGSRNPSPSGRENAFEFAKYLANCGLSITSGLALGVDGRAHQGALSASAPTVAVCGAGLDRIYPPQHTALAEAIAANGVLVSEFYPGTPPRRENFPRRNRLISGLSMGVLVVEAGLRSGSLITARLAAEQGREVFAIPGSIHNPLARGCHMLIRSGAKLVEGASDILAELGPLAGVVHNDPGSPVQPTSPAHPDLDDEYLKLLAACGYEPVTVDDLVERTRLTTAEVSSMLLILELQGFLESGAGGRYTRIFKALNSRNL